MSFYSQILRKSNSYCVCVSRFRRPWIYCGNQGFFSSRAWSYSSEKHSATWSCCQRWTPSVWRPHTGGTGELTYTFYLVNKKRLKQVTFFFRDNGTNKNVVNNDGILTCVCVCVCACIGKWCGYHWSVPRRVGVYAPQHPSGRKRVSGGLAAGRDVPAQRDGKNQSHRCTDSQQTNKIFSFSGGSLIRYRDFLFIPICMFNFQLPLIFQFFNS